MQKQQQHELSQEQEILTETVFQQVCPCPSTATPSDLEPSNHHLYLHLHLHLHSCPNYQVQFLQPSAGCLGTLASSNNYTFWINYYQTVAIQQLGKAS